MHVMHARAARPTHQAKPFEDQRELAAAREGRPGPELRARERAPDHNNGIRADPKDGRAGKRRHNAPKPQPGYRAEHS